MAKNYYAVKTGRHAGIYRTWEECKKEVNRFPGAKYKGLEDYDSAKAYIDGKPLQIRESNNSDFNGYSAYVDGSYNTNTGEYSSGVIILYNGEPIKQFSKKYNDSASVMRNVAGEIQAAKLAMQYCLNHQITKIKIFHDYEGIAAWCNGQWKAKNKYTAEYADFYHEASKSIQISFRKVKGHSDDTYNDLADKLAKSALGIK